MLKVPVKTKRRIDTLLSPFMFALSLVFLIGLAVLIVLWIDVPTLSESAVGVKAESTRSTATGSIAFFTYWTLVAIWPIFILESIFHWGVRAKNSEMWLHHVYGVLYCICPPLRLCASNPDLAGRMWLPGFGWRKSDRRLRRKMERRFSKPMLLIALLILPVLVVEFSLKEQVVQYMWLRVALHVCTGIIWFAFAAEFIVMVSVAERKLDYCKKHWIDIAIILLPIVSFLRSLRLVRASRIANVAKMSQISKMARVYRLRGTAMKMLRALLLMKFVHRIIGLTTEKKLKRLHNELEEKRREIAFLEEEIQELEREAAKESK